MTLAHKYVFFRSVELDHPPIRKIGEAVGNFILYAAVVKYMKYTFDMGWKVCNKNLQRDKRLCFVDKM